MAARERIRAVDAQGRHSRLLFSSALVQAGTFDVAREDPAFDSAGMIRDRIELVFPTVPVAIEQEGAAAFIADALRVVWYQPWQGFRRRAISRSGDHCMWLGFAPDCVEAALSTGHGAARLRDAAHCRGTGTRTAQLAAARAGFRRLLGEKMRLLLQRGPGATPVDDADLQEQLERRRAELEMPARRSLTHVFLSTDVRGEQALSDARALLAQLRSGSWTSEQVSEISDPFPIGMELRSYSELRLQARFGKPFAEQVFAVGFSAGHG